MLVLCFPAAQDAHKLQSEGVSKTHSILQRDTQVEVPSVGHIHHLSLVHVQPSSVVEQVPAQDVFLTEHQLVVEQEEAALLHLALSYDSRQLTGVHQL